MRCKVTFSGEFLENIFFSYVWEGHKKNSVSLALLLLTLCLTALEILLIPNSGHRKSESLRLNIKGMPTFDNINAVIWQHYRNAKEISHTSTNSRLELLYKSRNHLSIDLLLSTKYICPIVWATLNQIFCFMLLNAILIHLIFSASELPIYEQQNLTLSKDYN